MSYIVLWDGQISLDCGPRHTPSEANSGIGNQIAEYESDFKR